MSTHLNMYAIRTDLALEARELVSQTLGEKIPGLNVEMKEESGVTITSLQITTEHAAQTLGKPVGHYLTIETPQLRDKDSDLQNRISTLFAQYFAQYLHNVGISNQAKVLIVGLGNWNVTPDALGPMVVENVLVTRHYFELMPDQVEPGYRQVSAIAPGVLGITGIETSEIVRGIVDKSKPDVVIAIDALASKALERVNTTIQIANTGIHPGSGIGNKRKGLTEQELGIPVIAIGVPTVVYASTIVNSTIEMLLRNFEQQTEHTGAILGLLSSLTETERLEMVKEVLDPLGHNLLVTPKEIDQFIEDMAHLIATGLNAALHEAVHQQNVGAFTH